MRNDAKNQSAVVSNRIKKAKKSLAKMEGFSVPKTLQTEFVDLIPLGQFPEPRPNEEEKPSRK